MPNPIKTAPLGFRVTPRLAYILKLAAKEQKISVSSFVDQTLTNALLRPLSAPDDDAEIADTQTPINPRWQALWDEDEATRLYLLALMRPDLMEPNEARLWALLTGGIEYAGQPLTVESFSAAFNGVNVDKTHLERE